MTPCADRSFDLETTLGLKFLYMKRLEGQVAKKLWAHWKSLTIAAADMREIQTRDLVREHIFLSVPRKTHIGSFIKTHATIQY